VYPEVLNNVVHVPQWAVLPLVDNYDDDEFRYLIRVHTGFKVSSGTKSKVFFRLNGTKGETGFRKLDDGERQVRCLSISMSMSMSLCRFVQRITGQGCGTVRKGKERKRTCIAPIVSISTTKRSDVDHTELPANTPHLPFLRISIR